jgi:hypothetical protein
MFSVGDSAYLSVSALPHCPYQPSQSFGTGFFTGGTHGKLGRNERAS